MTPNSAKTPVPPHGGHWAGSYGGWMEVDADRLVIWYHEPDLVECTRLQTVPPRGFRLKTSMTGGQQYWPEV